MPEFKPDDITNVLRDALFVSVGLGVIAFQRAQVQRQELRKALKAQLGDARGQFDKLGDSTGDLASDARQRFERLADGFEDRVKVVEERLESVEGQIDQLLDELEDKLPEQARELVKSARDTAKDARAQVRNLVRRNGQAA